MDENKQALLEAKKQELSSQLEEWATTTFKITTGQQIVVKIGIEIVELPLVVLSLHKRITPIGNTLSEADWQKILAIPWAPKHLSIINRLHTEDNNPIRVDFECPIKEAINVVFRKNKLNYRLNKTERGGKWWEGFVQLFAVTGPDNNPR